MAGSALSRESPKGNLHPQGDSRTFSEGGLRDIRTFSDGGLEVRFEAACRGPFWQRGVLHHRRHFGLQGEPLQLLTD